MPTLIEYLDSAKSGPLLTEEDFNIKQLIPNIRKTLRDFDIQYTPEEPIVSDDGLADRLFNAAVEFIKSIGIYLDDVNRVIHFERDEIIDAINNLPRNSTFGEGRERRYFSCREPEDPRAPWCHVGTGIVASSEDVALMQVEGYAGIPQASSISIPAFNRVNDFEVVDTGIDNSPLTFIEQAEKAQVDVIRLSCLMTTTMPTQREVIQTLEEMKLRDKYMVIVGGGPVTQEWADQIGADGYSESAIQAVSLAKGLMDVN